MMIAYWFSILRLWILGKFLPAVAVDEVLSRTFRVKPFDCDGLRVMTAFKYAVYMDLIRWELIARSRLFKALLKRGMAPALGSQKIIYRKPLKMWSKFTLSLEAAGWDDKWVYHLHRFEQDGELKAIGITRALFWKRDVPGVLEDLMREVGVQELQQPPPVWVLKLFEDDAEIIAKEGSRKAEFGSGKPDEP